MPKRNAPKTSLGIVHIHMYICMYYNIYSFTEEVNQHQKIQIKTHTAFPAKTTEDETFG